MWRPAECRNRQTAGIRSMAVIDLTLGNRCRLENRMRAIAFHGNVRVARKALSNFPHKCYKQVSKALSVGCCFLHDAAAR